VKHVHPGEILEEELQARGMSASALAKALFVPPNRISAIIKGTRGITADTALRLARFLGTTPQFWLVLQISYDLAVAEEKSGHKIRNIKAAA
jgi:addiction module HigA family antidote